MPRSRKPRTGADEHEQLTLIDAPAPVQRAAPVGHSGEPECDCPFCTEGTDPVAAMEEVLTSLGADLIATADPLSAEQIGGAFLALGTEQAAAGGSDVTDLLADGIIPFLATRERPEAVAILLAVAALGDEVVQRAAVEAAAGLVGKGIAEPRWSAALRADVTPGEFWRISDPDQQVSVLLGSFRRAGQTHWLILTVDEEACGSAAMIGVATDIDRADLRSAFDDGIRATEARMEPAAFRRLVERALAARAHHDRLQPRDPDWTIPDWTIEVTDGESGPGDADQEDLEYRAMTILLRSRLEMLPAPKKPPRHPKNCLVGMDPWDGIVSALTQLAKARGVAPPPVEHSIGARDRRDRKPKLPAKRPKWAGPAPVYQIKVSLRGARPPIWRRLEVPADVKLARLHSILQAAFGWQEAHLHVFDTPYGRFGQSDPELGITADRSVTLEQVVPELKGKITYTYDFGDDWEHEILVEKIIDSEEGVAYPRCTGGKRAAPPEDCGGVWGYAELVSVLADPGHPEHEDRLDWLGLASRADFDPNAFDPAIVNQWLGARSRR